MDQSQKTLMIEITHWTRSCPICGRQIYKDAEDIDKPLPCPCGKWTWD